MKVPNLKKWSDLSSCEGLLFFAQMLEELLFHHTIDSFKAPALNTHSNALELQSLAQELMLGRIKTGTVRHVIEELEDRVSNDPVLDRSHANVIKSLLLDITNSTSKPERFFTLSNSLLVAIGDKYWSLLRKALGKAISDSRNKKAIVLLARTLTSEIEIRGFSRQFLYKRTLDFFFEPNEAPPTINSPDQIETFLDSFNAKTREWSVLFKGSPHFLKFLSHAGLFNIELYRDLNSETGLSHLQNRFIVNKRAYPVFIITKKIKAKDHYMAREIASYTVDFFSDVCRFHDHHSRLYYSTPSFVIENDSQNIFFLNSPPNPMAFGASKNRTVVNDEIKTAIEVLKGVHFSPSSVDMFPKVFDYHRAAMETKTPENQLLDLWAALEGFLPAPPPDEDRIQHFLKYLIPPLLLTYPEKIFRYISQGLHNTGQNIIDYVGSLNFEADFFNKTIALLVSEGLDSQRSTLYSMLEHHPILKYRCFWCYDNFHSKKHVKNLINTHKQRISWHIQRIYTARNRIIHSAESMPYLKTLIENLHTYVDILVLSLIKLAKSKNMRLSIDSALGILSAHAKVYENELSDGDVACSLSNYHGIIFGVDNPLSPSS